MKQLASISWSVILGVAVAWPLVWLFVPTIGVISILRAAPESDSGGLAAIGFGITTSGTLLLLVPPILLLILRAVAARVRPR